MKYVEKLNVISENLRRSKKVNSFDSSHEKEADVLAYSLLDIAESSHLVLNKLLPKLVSDNVSEEVVDETLLDIGEELRHILYHIRDPKFYAYLREDD